MKKILWLLVVILLSFQGMGQSCLGLSEKETKKKMKEFPEYELIGKYYTVTGGKFLVYDSNKTRRMHYFFEGTTISTRLLCSIADLSLTLLLYNKLYEKEEEQMWRHHYEDQEYIYAIDIEKDDLFSVWIIKSENLWFIAGGE